MSIALPHGAGTSDKVIMRSQPAHLPPPASLQARPEPVAVTEDLHDVHVVGQAIQQCPGHPLVVGEDLRPVGERQVCRHDQARLLVALAEEAEQVEDDANRKQCILVLIGATADGKKELIAVLDGYRESEQSWLELLHDVRRRGLAIEPMLAIADGALGFWAAVRKVWPTTRRQRCWVHKTANALNKLPKSIQLKAKARLHDIWQAETREAAEHAFDAFVEDFQAKYPNAAACLVKDREALLAFYDFPAEHWIHLRTTNPIESTFATVRLRHRRTKGNGSRLACLAMVFKLARSAEKRRRRLNGHELIPDVIQGVRFIDGIKEKVAA